MSSPSVLGGPNFPYTKKQVQSFNQAGSLDRRTLGRRVEALEMVTLTALSAALPQRGSSTQNLASFKTTIVPADNSTNVQAVGQSASLGAICRKPPAPPRSNDLLNQRRRLRSLRDEPAVIYASINRAKAPTVSVLPHLRPPVISSSEAEIVPLLDGAVGGVLPPSGEE